MIMDLEMEAAIVMIRKQDDDPCLATPTSALDCYRMVNQAI